MNLPPPSWAPDPWQDAEERWWDGTQWTPFTRSSPNFGPPLNSPRPHLPAKRKGLPLVIVVVLVFLGLVIPGFSSYERATRATEPPPKESIATAWGAYSPTDHPAKQATTVAPAHKDEVAVFSPLIRWDPCTPIKVRFSLDASPHSEEKLGAPINAAFKELSSVSGMRFENAGFIPYREAAVFYPLAETGSRNYLPPPLTDFEGVTVIFLPAGVSIPPNFHEEKGDPVGLAASFPYAFQNDITYSKQGVVYVESNSHVPLQFVKSLLLHELGHIMGLDHSTKGHLMRPSLAAPASWNSAKYSTAEADTLRNLLGSNGPCLLR